MSVTRRQLLGGLAAGAGATVIGPGAGAVLAAPAAANPEPARGAGPVPGPLVPDPNGLLALPAGFSYNVVAESGVTEMITGEKTPDNIDGTGAFRHGDHVRLIQNHELRGTIEGYPVPKTPGTVYDDGLVSAGGCTVVEVDSNGDRLAEWVGLSGTLVNCAGGQTLWDTWLTCEETEVKAGEDYGAGGIAARDHGYVFEVWPDDSSEQHPVPIRAWGRYPHEAAVFGRSGKDVYLTEDASEPNGLFYRWMGEHHLHEGSLQELDENAGELAAMAVVVNGAIVDDLSRFTSQHINQALSVTWIPVPDRHAMTTSTRLQFADGTVTRSKKFEGAWADEDGVWIAVAYAHPDSPDVVPGGVAHDGQIWHYHVESQKLRLKAYFPYQTQFHDGSMSLEDMLAAPITYFDGPDNIHVSPFGGIVMAEDGDGLQHLVGWTQRTGAFALARNDLLFEDGYEEMTGPVFSPINDRVLFANVQVPGHTYAITGPFERYLRTRRSGGEDGHDD